MSEIREGQKAKLSFKTENNSQKEFDCSIKNLYTDRFSLQFPQEIFNYLEYLEEGEEVSVKIVTPGGVKVFDALILNSPQDSEFVLEYVEESVQIQRREYTRVELKTKIIIQRQDNLNIVTNTIEISGGNARFVYEGSFGQDEVVDILLYLPGDNRSIQIQGIMQHKEHLPENEHILLFTKLNERDRDKIIKKCFDIQINRYIEI